jgi:hypothetical protein
MASPTKRKSGKALTLTAEGSLVDNMVKPCYNKHIHTKEHLKWEHEALSR